MNTYSSVPEADVLYTRLLHETIAINELSIPNKLSRFIYLIETWL